MPLGTPRPWCVYRSNAAAYPAWILTSPPQIGYLPDAGQRMWYRSHCMNRRRFLAWDVILRCTSPESLRGFDAHTVGCVHRPHWTPWRSNTLSSTSYRVCLACGSIRIASPHPPGEIRNAGLPGLIKCHADHGCLASDGVPHDPNGYPAHSHSICPEACTMKQRSQRSLAVFPRGRTGMGVRDRLPPIKASAWLSGGLPTSSWQSSCMYPASGWLTTHSPG
jgi:hypothetical protein